MFQDDCSPSCLAGHRPARTRRRRAIVTSLTDAQGKALAQGKYLQRVEGDVLHVEARYDFPDGRSIVERAPLRLHP